jgi:hypothetical protein
MFFWRIGTCVPKYTASLPKKRYPTMTVIIIRLWESFVTWQKLVNCGQSYSKSDSKRESELQKNKKKSSVAFYTVKPSSYISTTVEARQPATWAQLHTPAAVNPLEGLLLANQSWFGFW